MVQTLVTRQSPPPPPPPSLWEGGGGGGGGGREEEGLPSHHGLPHSVSIGTHYKRVG